MSDKTQNNSLVANDQYVGSMKGCLDHFILAENDEERLQALDEIMRETKMHRSKFVKSNVRLNKVYEIYYNDGAYYGKVTFKGKTKVEIDAAMQAEIHDNNKNVNPAYHISKNNFKEVN